MSEGGLTLVFDEQFSHKQIGFLAAESRGTHSVRLIHVRQRGWSSKPDAVWMPQAVGEGFVIVTADRNARTREITVEEFRRMGARVLLVGSFWDHRGRWAQAKWLVARLERLIGTATGMGAGDVLLVAADGKIRAAE